MKVTQYGSDAIIVINGKQLWFVHSIKLSSLIIQPFQVQEVYVSFKAKLNDVKASDSCEEGVVVIFSHFCEPITRKFIVEPNVSLMTILPINNTSLTHSFWNNSNFSLKKSGPYFCIKISKIILMSIFALNIAEQFKSKG